jgi:hypothetical protein
MTVVEGRPQYTRTEPVTSRPRLETTPFQSGGFSGLSPPVGRLAAPRPHPGGDLRP